MISFCRRTMQVFSTPFSFSTFYRSRSSESRLMSF
jgi:hypothetical protein